jgi:hypothetical protein
MSELTNITTKTRVVRSIRQMGERYGASTNVDTRNQADVLTNMANAIMINDFSEASLYFASLHNNIKQALEFHVLDYMGKAETHFIDEVR